MADGGIGPGVHGEDEIADTQVQKQQRRAFEVVLDFGEEVPIAVDGFGLGGEFGVLRVDGVSGALQQFRFAGIGAPKGGEMRNHFAEQVRGGVRVDDVVDAFSGDDERVAEGLAFRSVDPRLISLVEPGWVLALIVGCEVADDEGIGGPA